MNRLLKTLMVVMLMAVTLGIKSGTVSAANIPFTCSPDFYQVISGQLKQLDPLTGSYSNIGSAAGFDYNAIGYNSVDDYIYGFVFGGPQNSHVIRVSSDGTTSDLGVPAGLPVAGYYNASFDTVGNMYIRADADTIYKVNVSGMTTTTITTTGDNMVDGFDNVFINDKLYLLSGANLSVVDLDTNIVTTGTVSGPSGWLTASSGFGAGWADQDGELFFSNNGTGSIYEITNYDSPTPTAVFKVAGTVTSNNDGASCSLAQQSPFDPPVATDDSYTALFNTPLHETTIPVVGNDVGSSLTVTSHTNPTHGTVSINADGSFLYTPKTGFSGTDSFDYTVTDSFARTASATVTITILPTSLPKAPNTGYGTPNHSNPLIQEVISASLVLIGGGLLILHRQKRNYSNRIK